MRIPIVRSIALALPILAAACAGDGDSVPEAQTVAVRASRPANGIVAARLLDATTARPIEGARVELWTESWDAPADLVDRVSTAVDGTFVLESLQVEGKIVVRAEGYRSTVLSGLPNDEVFLFPADDPFELRVLDLAGEPIAGARVRTHQTCAHAPAASAGVTDELGRLALADFPALSQLPTIEVMAEGHGALHSLAPEELLASEDQPRAGDVFLPRRRSILLRVLDEGGQALAGRRLTLGEAPAWQAVWTDAHGRASIDSSFFGRELVLQARDRDGQAFVDETVVPREGVWTVRVDGDQFEGDEEESATLVLEGPGVAESEAPPPVRVLHEEGWVFLGAGPHRVPPGALRVVLGAAFSGVRESVLDLELAAGEERTVAIELVPEPVLAVRLPASGEWTVHVQAGGDSVTRVERVEDVLTVPVPPDEPILVVAVGPRGEAHRAELEPLAADIDCDLAGSETLMRPSAWRERAHGPHVPITVRATDAGGKTLALRATLHGALGTAQDDDDDPERAVFSVPPGVRYEILVEARGRVPRWLVGTAPAAGASEGVEETVTLEARARVVSAFGPAIALEAAGRRVERSSRADGPLVLDGLAPGPLGLTFVYPDGSRVLRRLSLAPGEERRVEAP